MAFVPWIQREIPNPESQRDIRNRPDHKNLLRMGSM